MSILSRRYKVLVELAADILSFVISFFLSAVILGAPAAGLAVPALVTAVISIVLLYLFHYYQVKLEKGSIELVARGLGAQAVCFAVAIIVYIALGRTENIIFTLSTRHIFSRCLWVHDLHSGFTSSQRTGSGQGKTIRRR